MMEIRGYKLTLKNVFNLGLGMMERLLSNRCLNVWKTVYINYRCLPLTQAIKFPIVVRGGVKINSLMGSIQILPPIRYGMIELGSKIHNEFVCVNKSRLFLDGTLVFYGGNKIMNGYQISVQRNATLTFGSDCYLGENISIVTHNKIDIDSYNRIAYNSIIMDTDMHYSINTVSRDIYKNNIPIHIGSSNWIGNGTRIMKGTVTPDWTIVTAGSFLNKDYTKTIGEGCIIGGSPAKLIKEGQKRIFSLENEMVLDYFFRKNPQQSKFVLAEDVDIDKFCQR